MFDFLRKKKKTVTLQSKKDDLSEEDKIVLRERCEVLVQEIHEFVEENPEKIEYLAERYEQLGLAQATLGKEEAAIETLEKSLSLKLSIGDGYKKLMNLYNAKRAEAARNGDDAGIEKYMNKMDDMRQIAKKVTITG